MIPLPVDTFIDKLMKKSNLLGNDKSALSAYVSHGFYSFDKPVNGRRSFRICLKLICIRFGFSNIVEY